MILYFTGTGNSRYIANAITSITKDELVSINEKIKTKDPGHSDRRKISFCIADLWLENSKSCGRMGKKNRIYRGRKGLVYYELRLRNRKWSRIYTKTLQGEIFFLHGNHGDYHAGKLYCHVPDAG